MIGYGISLGIDWDTERSFFVSVLGFFIWPIYLGLFIKETVQKKENDRKNGNGKPVL